LRHDRDGTASVGKGFERHSSELATGSNGRQILKKAGFGEP